MPYALDRPAERRTVSLCHRLSWGVLIGCEQGHATRIGPNDLAERFPGGTTLEAIAARLVCSVCGSRDGRLGIYQDGAEASRRDLERVAREASVEADRPLWMRKNPGGPSPGPGGRLRPIEGDG
jgi:hypothetical protein